MVGDDWQAIFRFAGSDIAVMRGFEERFGAGARSNLETTFQCSDGLCDVATRFVLGNPAQIVKKVRSVRRVDGPGVWIGFGGDGAEPLLHQALDRIATEAAQTEGRPSVLLLGRYRRLIPDLRPLQRNHPGLDLTYRTVHAAKGLEADYVVVLGICSGRYGFPTEITDDPLLDLVLAAPEEHPNAEERRLFYRRPDARQAADVPAGGGRTTLGFRRGTPASGWPDRHLRLAECGRSALPRMQEGGVSCRGRVRVAADSTAAPTTPIASTRSRRVPTASKDCRCGTGKPSDARSADSRSRAAPGATGGLGAREGKHGPFLGCSNWPACEFTSPI